MRLFHTGDVDMTEGSTTRHLIRFAMPLLLGMLFQQFYNTVDIWVLGNFATNEAFSAVGAVSSIINILIGFFTGLATGVGVVISQYYGAKKEEEVNKTVHTAMLMTFCLGLIFTAVGILTTPLMLALTRIPDEVLPDATDYLTIYFAGVMGLLVYNLGAGILRAVGDSVKPFFYLVLSALLNVALDVLFVRVFAHGAQGVAYATIIAQGISALCIVVSLMRSRGAIRFSFRKLRFYGYIFKSIVRIGLPTALQVSITSFSNVFVQSYINHFGADFIAGWTAYSKVDHVTVLPMQSISLAVTTFVAQNIGVGNTERSRKGLRAALLLSLAGTVILMTPILIFAPQLTAFFNGKAEVVSYGTVLLRLISPFYVLFTVNEVFSGALRGVGDVKAAMMIKLFAFVLFRQIYLFVFTRFVVNSEIAVALSYPIGWFVASVFILLYYRRAGLSQRRTM